MKDFYFQHDFYARNDPKCSAMIADLGIEAYGIYWFIIELLHTQGGKIEKFPKLYKGLSRQMGIEEEALLKHIQALVNDYKLLKEDDDFIWSDRVLENIKQQEEKRKQKQEAGRLGGQKRVQNQAETSTTQAEPKHAGSENNQKKGKESKRKEKKINNNDEQTAVAVADNLNDLIKLFEKVNPNYERLYPNTSQRNALDRQVKKFGYDRMKRLLEDLPRIVQQKYAPQITTPIQLENKMGDLIQFLNKEKQKQQEGVPKVATMT